MMLNEDYRDILRMLSEEGAEFLLVGAFAMAAHGHIRATIDIDIWVKPSSENAEAVIRALRRFGAQLHGLTLEDLQQDDFVFKIGVAPRRIDILTGVSGLRFEETYVGAILGEIDGIEVRTPRLEDLLRNKLASGRKQDLVDVETIESLISSV